MLKVSAFYLKNKSVIPKKKKITFAALILTEAFGLPFL